MRLLRLYLLCLLLELVELFDSRVKQRKVLYLFYVLVHTV